MVGDVASEAVNAKATVTKYLAVEKAEQGDNRDDVDDLTIRIVLFQLGEVRVGDRVRHLRRALRDPQRGALRFREKRAPLKLPERILLFCGDADAFSRVRDVRHAVAASSGTTRHLRDYVAEPRIDRRARPVDCRAELGKRFFGATPWHCPSRPIGSTLL